MAYKDISSHFSLQLSLSYQHSIETSIDPLGRPSVTVGRDHCFHTCRPSHFSKSSKTKQSENNVLYCGVGRVDHWDINWFYDWSPYGVDMLQIYFIMAPVMLFFYLQKLHFSTDVQISCDETATMQFLIHSTNPSASDHIFTHLSKIKQKIQKMQKMKIMFTVDLAKWIIDNPCLAIIVLKATVLFCERTLTFILSCQSRNRCFYHGNLNNNALFGFPADVLLCLFSMEHAKWNELEGCISCSQEKRNEKV